MDVNGSWVRAGSAVGICTEWDGLILLGWLLQVALPQGDLSGTVQTGTCAPPGLSQLLEFLCPAEIPRLCVLRGEDRHLAFGWSNTASLCISSSMHRDPQFQTPSSLRRGHLPHFTSPCAAGDAGAHCTGCSDSHSGGKAPWGRERCCLGPLHAAALVIDACPAKLLCQAAPLILELGSNGEKQFKKASEGSSQTPIPEKSYTYWEWVVCCPEPFLLRGKGLDFETELTSGASAVDTKSRGCSGACILGSWESWVLFSWSFPKRRKVTWSHQAGGVQNLNAAQDNLLPSVSSPVLTSALKSS